MDQAHEQVTDLCPVLGFIKQGVFAVKDRLFQSLLADVIIQGRPGIGGIGGIGGTPYLIMTWIAAFDQIYQWHA